MEVSTARSTWIDKSRFLRSESSKLEAQKQFLTWIHTHTLHIHRDKREREVERDREKTREREDRKYRERRRERVEKRELERKKEREREREKERKRERESDGGREREREREGEGETQLLNLWTITWMLDNSIGELDAWILGFYLHSGDRRPFMCVCLFACLFG